MRSCNLKIQRMRFVYPQFPSLICTVVFFVLSGGSFIIAALMIIVVGRRFRLASLCWIQISDVTNLIYVFDLIYVSRDLDIQSMAVDMTNWHHVGENGRSFNSVFEVAKPVDFSRFCCILFYTHLLHTIITYSEHIWLSLAEIIVR